MKNTPKNHADAVNLCRLRATELGGMLLPYTVGGFRDANGRLVRVGILGVADLIGVINGRPIACEVKVGKDRQREDQKKFEQAWTAAGGVYVIARFEPGEGVECLKAI